MSDFGREFYGRRGDVTICLVDGKEIRDSSPANEQFTNFGQHYRWPKLVPEKHIWIDKAVKKFGLTLIIDQALAEYKAMQDGKSYDEAVDIGDREREREIGRKKNSTGGRESRKVSPGVYIKKLMQLGPTEVWLVDGDIARNTDPEWADGGNYHVDDFIPDEPPEIWIDNAMDKADRKPTIVHEASECLDMAAGMDYDTAHIKASKIEWDCRCGKKDCDTVLAELARNFERHYSRDADEDD